MCCKYKKTNIINTTEFTLSHKSPDMRISVPDENDLV